MTPLIRFLVAQDCWYLLSGFLMLLGCYLMSQAPGADSVELGAGLTLQLVVLAYQVAVVGLAIFVRRRLRVENDAFNLACVALVLLPDPTFFTARFWSHSWSAGVAINSVALLASALLLVWLAEIGKFPIRGRSMAAWLTLLVIVFGAGAFFEPGIASRNRAVIDLLAFAPLVLAAISGRYDEGPREALPRDERLMAHPVLWGDPRLIYRRYLAAIVLAYPTLIVLRHLDGLSAIFGHELGVAHLAPAVLAAGVLLIKAAHGVQEISGLFTVLGGVSLLMASALHSDMPYWSLMLGANIAVSAWIVSSRSRQSFPYYATACAALFAGGPNPDVAFEALLTLQPEPMMVLAAAAAWHAWRDRGFWEIYTAVLGGVAVLVRTAPIHGATAAGALLHAAALVYIAGVHLYPRKDLKDGAPLIAALALMSLVPAAQSGSLTAQAALFAEAVAFLLAAQLTGMGSYAIVTLGVVGMHAGIAVFRNVPKMEMVKLFWTWSGPAAVAASFATLAVGAMATKARMRG